MERSRVFNIKQKSGSEKEFEYIAQVIENHKIFEGHFPKTPVVPGVCTLNMIKECIEDIMGHYVRYSYIKECKFLGVIIPSEQKKINVKITLQHKSEEGIDLISEILFEDTKIMNLKATVKLE